MPPYNFDNRTAIFLAAVCSQTYKQYEDPDGKFVVPVRYSLADEFYGRSFAGVIEKFGFILESDQRIIVAFRGTSSATDWISDIIASQEPFKLVRGAGETHRGISEIYYSMRKKIVSVLSRLPVNKPIWATGHSLGGALATLFALDLSENAGRKPPLVYTYGSPRVGDPVFARAYGNAAGGSSYRIYNLFDVVPLMPPHVYKPPGSMDSFAYMHVKEGVQLEFRDGSVASNHMIGSYFNELAKRDPIYVEQLRLRNPGFCPE